MTFTLFYALNTIFNYHRKLTMAILQNITWRSLPIETVNAFTANFNNPVGQYGFTQNAANQNQVVINTNPNYIYLLDRLSFSASIGENIFLESTGPGATIPQFRLKFLKGSEGKIYPFGFPAINYKDNLEFSFWFRSPQGADALLIDFTGVLNQVPATVGLASIISQVSLVIYQENNGDQIQQMLEKTAKSIGSMYRVGAV